MRGSLVLFLLTTFLAVTGSPPAQAACVADRQLFAPYSYIYTPGITNGHLDSTVTEAFLGSFWALGAGHPAPQAGIDNGRLAAIDGNSGGWLTIRPKVGAYGYPPLIESSWNAAPVIDGCIDTTGSDPEAPDRQQCIVALFADQHAAAGFFAIASAPADGAGDYDLTVPGDQPILLTEIPRPVSNFDPYLQDPINTLTLPAPLLDGSGQTLDRDCADVITGYRVYRQIVPRGAAPPVDRTRDDGVGTGWEVASGGQLPSGQPLPLGQSAELQLLCAQRSDVYLAFSLTFDSGYETPYLSRNHIQFAIDCCADADGDGVCAEPSEMRDHDCDDSNPFCSTDCTDADLDQHCAPEDCDDGDPALHGDIPEVCDGVDNNCDGRSDEAPVSLMPLAATGTVTNARFGEAIAGLGDVDDDGYGDFIVGASFDSESGFSQAGSATVVSGRTGALLHRITHPDPQGGDHFGSAVIRIGDVNADGIDDILIGALDDDTSAAVDSGTAQVVSGSRAAAFERLYTLSDPAGTSLDGFGSSLAALDDHNGDGVRDLAVGVPGANGARGKVVVFSGASGQVLRTLTDPDGQPGDRFGCSVAGLGDLDGDGLGELLAASCNADSAAAVGAGKVVLINGTSWLPLGTLFDPLGEPGDAFGQRLTAVTDIDRDSMQDVLIGVPGDDDAVHGLDSGSAMLFSGASHDLLYRLTLPAAEAGDRFGLSVAALGDLNGDGIPEVGVGAPDDDTADGADAGSVGVFSGASGQWMLTLESAAPSPGNGFGSSLTSAGSLDDDGVSDLVVGASRADSGSGAATGNAETFSGAGSRDLDSDGTGDDCDCAPRDPDAQVLPTALQSVVVGAGLPTELRWADPGTGFLFDLASGLLSELRNDAGLARAGCLIDDTPEASVQDTRPAPPVGDGYYYLPRSSNSCGTGSYGLNSSGIERTPGEDCP